MPSPTIENDSLIANCVQMGAEQRRKDGDQGGVPGRG
jgi:hypothetical protein